MTRLQTRSIIIDVKSLNKSDGIGTFQGYAAYFNNIDRTDDIIAPDAFNDVNAENVSLLWGHDQKEIIGGVISLTPDTNGLFGKFELNLEVPRAAQGYALLKAGHLKTMSIGYRVKDREWINDGNIRLIKKAELLEISLVAIPANPKAEVTAVKSVGEVRELENYLRDAYGLSINEAKAFIANHWKPFTRTLGKRDVAENETDFGELRHLISSKLNTKQH